ncbi:FBD domain [Arabidopsis thaliana x Arabidopsis arenosa]|uniref:FBD domain n=1 Tax=Arabidopsis thaliana x Arabidopsis arenosa TaxID=1240361 RepID=A0A8T1ZS32_9BRAS|nr:FBD domain [Arabidopsis thaliana x Arabidopsis arenosa]
MDRISNLSNEIICHIVSFLSAKEATVASVLSKRWQNLYTIIPNLEFDNTLENQGSLKDFLNGLLALPACSRIRNVSIKLRKREYHDLNLFLCNVLKRGVLKLKLDIWATLDGGYSLPVEIFTCKTLVELELGSILQIDLVPENALLPALKTLTIDSVRFSDQSGCAFQKLISSCPVLVELGILNVEWEQWEWSRKVSSPTLERLTINHRYYFAYIGNIYYDMEGITFDTPSLTNLKYYDFPPQSYPMVNLDSLVEATVGLKLPLHHAWTREYARHGDTIPSVTNLIKGLRNVETLNLTCTDTVDAFYFSHEAIPVFENLHHLSIATERKFCWRTLPYLLKKSPNLETLVIEGPLHYNYQLGDEYESDEVNYYEDESESDDDESICECLSEYSFLESCLVKTVEITEYSGTKKELEHMKHFLEKLSCLELVKVCSNETDDEEQIQLRTNLLNIPRSSKCKIEFEFIPPRSFL